MALNHTNGLNILGDRGYSNENIAADVQFIGGHTHLVLNNGKLAAILLGMGKRVIYRFKGQGEWDDDNAHSNINARERVRTLNILAPPGAFLYLTNEPTGNYELLNSWTLEALDECGKLGRKAVIFNFAVGNPSKATLEILHPAVERAYQRGDLLGWHEYRNPKDGNGYIPEDHYDIGRFLDGREVYGARCPEIVITELGVTVDYKDSQGYRTIWNDQQLREAVNAWTAFYAAHRVKVCWYAYKAKGDPKWDSFEMDTPAARQALKEANERDIPVTELNYGSRIEQGVIKVVGATVVNIRNLPTTQGSVVLGQFVGGEVVPFWSIPRNGWWQIEVNGKPAFTSDQFIDIVALVQEPPPPTIPPFPDTIEAAQNLANILKEGEVASQIMFQFANRFREWVEDWIARNGLDRAA